MVRTDITEYDEPRVKSNSRPLFPGFLLTILLVLAAAPAVADDPKEAELTIAQMRDELVEAALHYSPEHTRPVLNADGTPVAIFHDLNGDEFTDIAILTVLAEPGVPTGLANLRETSRLFRTPTPSPFFVLETFFAGREAVQTVELGRKPALGGIELLHLSEGSPFPVAISVEMRGAAGSENNLLIYSPSGMIQRLQLQETPRERYQLADLDQNGTVDIVVTRRLPEAGRGYETFLELLILDDNSYVSAASFGLVRELQEFLRTAADHIAGGGWDALEQMVRADGGDGDILSRAFQVVPDEEEMEESVFDYAETGVSVTAVVFPVILENPFPYPYLGTQFTVAFRVECCDGYPHVFSAIVELSDYPFDEYPFAFLTHAGAQR